MGSLLREGSVRNFRAPGVGEETFYWGRREEGRGKEGGALGRGAATPAVAPAPALAGMGEVVALTAGLTATE